MDKKVVYEKVKKGGGTRRIRTAKHACGSTSSNHGEKLWFEKLTPKFERKRSYFPIIPVKFGEEQTTVMIRNIPNKYKYVPFLPVVYHCSICAIENFVNCVSLSVISALYISFFLF